MNHDWKKAAKHIRTTGLSGDWKSLEARYEKPGFETLCRIMAFQQVAGAHALKVVERVESHYEGCLPTTTDFVEGDAAEVFTRYGVAAFRANRMREVAVLIEENGLVLPSEDHDDVMDELTAIKGVGHWTASMYRMFALASPDIWPTTDLGVLKGLALYRKADIQKIKKVPDEGREWAPYRTLATWFLWQLVPGFPLPGFRRAEGPTEEDSSGDRSFQTHLEVSNHAWSIGWSKNRSVA